MAFSETVGAFETYDLWLLVAGVAVLVAASLPRFLSDQPLSMPIVLTGIGILVIALPLGLSAPDPLAMGNVTEHVTEAAVIIALMSAGLKIDRFPGWRRWRTTWRLLGVTMILTIGCAAVVGWRLAGFVPATAALLGAVAAPTDPVLASEVQVGPPRHGSQATERDDLDPKHTEEDEVRFSLTSEAGLNDGLAFPFTNLAIAMVLFGAHPSGWFGEWFFVDVLYKIVVAIVLGAGSGWLLGGLILRIPARTEVARSVIGLAAVGATFVIYGLTETFGGYGFIAVFVGAVVIRHHRGEHVYHRPLYLAAERTERLLTAVILVGFGAAVAGGLLGPLDLSLIAVALAIVFIIRPVAGVVGLLGVSELPWRERTFIGFFGVRGIGSIYYLSFALNEAEFPQAEELWAVIGLVILLSIVVHGTLAAPLTNRLDRMRHMEEAK